jgi:hypothetical protein
LEALREEKIVRGGCRFEESASDDGGKARQAGALKWETPSRE